MFQIIFLQAAGGFDQRTMIMMLSAFAVLYFFMIRPQMRRQKKEKQFQQEIKKGTKVVTSSGIHGRIAEVNKDGTLLIETGAGKIKFERAAISMDLTKKYLSPQKK